MKRFIALMLSCVFAFACTGCSEIEKEHFDKSMYTDMEGTATIAQSVKVSIDPEVLGKAVVEISYNMINSYEDETTDENAYLPEAESYSDYADEFLNEFLNEIRIALDEDKMFSYSVNTDGGMNFDNGYSDQHMTISFNNITLDCGNVYGRGDKVYMDKKLFYTLGAINYIYDTNTLGEYFNALDEFFADKEYVTMSYENVMAGIGSGDVATAMAGNALQKQSEEMYEQAKEVLVGFDSGCVTRIENGTRFELNSDEFADLSTRFATYLRQHSNSASQLVNDYMALIFATSMDIYGSDTEDILGTYEDMEISSDDVIMAMEGLKEVVNSPEYKTIFDTLKINLVNDITTVDNTRVDKAVYTGTYNEETAFTIEAVNTVASTESYEFTNLDEVNSAEYSELFNKLMDFQMDLYSGDYTLSTDYVCPDCGETFAYTDTAYCNKCGFVHDYYEYDENCDKQPGCELAAEANQVIA